MKFSVGNPSSPLSRKYFINRLRPTLNSLELDVCVYRSVYAFMPVSVFESHDRLCRVYRMCACVCVCARARARDREIESVYLSLHVVARVLCISMGVYACVFVFHFRRGVFAVHEETERQHITSSATYLRECAPPRLNNGICGCA